ncbi:MAG: dihydroneopterin aldolase [Candidatus Parcubacteria bacterium]|jgi:dihydroneopterin aldolase
MITKINIKKFITKVSIGITPEERARAQPLTIDLSLSINADKAIQTDDVHYTINYSELQKSILEITSTTSYNLLESLAFHIVRKCFEHVLVENVEITINKPYILSGSESAGITLTFTRHEYNLSSTWKQHR